MTKNSKAESDSPQSDMRGNAFGIGCDEQTGTPWANDSGDRMAFVRFDGTMGQIKVPDYPSIIEHAEVVPLLAGQEAANYADKTFPASRVIVGSDLVREALLKLKDDLDRYERSRESQRSLSYTGGLRIALLAWPDGTQALIVANPSHPIPVNEMIVSAYLGALTAHRDDHDKRVRREAARTPEQKRARCLKAARYAVGQIDYLCDCDRILAAGPL